jgi:hypothetical protein
MIEDIELEDEQRILSHDPEFLKPQCGSWLRKRTDWIFDAATKTLETAKIEELPHWTIPKIEAVVRKTGKSIDFEIEEEYKDEIMLGYNCSGDEREMEEVESNWPKQAATRMTHSVSRD